MTASAPFLRLPLDNPLASLDAASILAGGSLPINVERASTDVLLNDILRLCSIGTALPPPVLVPSDTGNPEKEDTVVEGEVISCFTVGGEKRLCFPQLLSLVLRTASTQHLNQAIKDLEVNLARCTGTQLDILKRGGIIPPSSPNCGLVTLSDAYRLITILIHARTPRPRLTPARSSYKASPKGSILVEHDCLGGAKGHLIPGLYSSSSAECIECMTCGDVFSPENFVMHSHKPCSRRTCHWGFDSTKWRNYIHACKDQTSDAEAIVKDAKQKFDTCYVTKPSPIVPLPVIPTVINPLKRKADTTTGQLSSLDVITKRLQMDAAATAAALTPVSYLMSYEPSLIQAYYTALLSNKYPNLGCSTVPAACSTKTAAAEGLLALSSSLASPPSLASTKSSQSPTPPENPVKGMHVNMHRQEPLKKLILQQYEEQQKRASNASNTSSECRNSVDVDGESESTSSASEGADDGDRGASLDSLLKRYINEDDGLQLVRTRIAQSQASLERQVDSLTSQNIILQQEMRNVRCRQHEAREAAVTSTSTSTSVSTSSVPV